MSAIAVERCPWCGSQITHAKFLKVQAAIREDERKRLADAEKAIAQKLVKERQAFEAEKARILKQIELAKQQMEQQRKKELAEVRRILELDRQNALLKRDAEFAREREALQKKIAEMSRRVKKGGEVAEGGELDLYEELRGGFPDDHVVRQKGRSGLLVHDIRYKGKSAGKIVLDVTPRAAWQQAFLSKLRQAQTEIAADYAILSTPVFPSGKRELFVESGVIVIAPARVRAMVEVLRKSLVAMYAARLGEAERADKIGRLYRFITSPAFKRKLGEASDLATEALEIDVQEKRAHDTVWKKRGTVLTRIRHILRDIDTDVSAIIEARDEEAPAPPRTVLRPAAWRLTTKDEE